MGLYQKQAQQLTGVIKMPSNPIYDRRSPQYRPDYVFPHNETAWWQKNNKNPVVRALVHYALTLKEPFTIHKLQNEAKYMNGNLICASGRMSPGINKIRAMIRLCGYFKKSEEKVVVGTSKRWLWVRK